MLDSDDANNPPNDYSAPAASQVKQKRRHFRPAHRHSHMRPINLVHIQTVLFCQTLNLLIINKKS